MISKYVNFFCLLILELIEQARQKGGTSRNNNNESNSGITNLGIKNSLSQSNCCGGGNNNSN